MSLLNIVGFNPIDGYFALGGIILIIYVFFTRRRLKKLQEKIPDTPSENTEKDVLGMDKPIPNGVEHFTSLDKVMKWKVVLLVVLMIIGLYLVVFQGPTINKDKGPVESIIKQGSFE